MRTTKAPYFSPSEIEKGRELLRTETVTNATRDTVFQVGIHCIISASERWSNANAVHGRLMQNGFGHPNHAAKNPRKLQSLLEGTRWPRRKFKYVTDFISWWSETAIPQEIVNDLLDGRRREFELRNALAKSAPGISYKSASLLMMKLGYENVVPLDIWETRFLREIGCKIRVGDYKTTSGPKGAEYLAHEAVVLALARRESITPALFHATLWAKNSSWGKGTRASANNDSAMPK
jgi:thermostable 8-oxoguanine DNA glycosylase